MKRSEKHGVSSPDSAHRQLDIQRSVLDRGVVDQESLDQQREMPFFVPRNMRERTEYIFEVEEGVAHIQSEAVDARVPTHWREIDIPTISHWKDSENVWRGSSEEGLDVMNIQSSDMSLVDSYDTHFAVSDQGSVALLYGDRVRIIGREGVNILLPNQVTSVSLSGVHFTSDGAVRYASDSEFYQYFPDSRFFKMPLSRGMHFVVAEISGDTYFTPGSDGAIWRVDVDTYCRFALRDGHMEQFRLHPDRGSVASVFQVRSDRTVLFHWNSGIHIAHPDGRVDRVRIDKQFSIYAYQCAHLFDDGSLLLAVTKSSGSGVYYVHSDGSVERLRGFEGDQIKTFCIDPQGRLCLLAARGATGTPAILRFSSSSPSSMTDDSVARNPRRVF